MKLACNIDRRGQKARVVGGVMVDLAGVGLVVIGVLTGSQGALTGGVLLCVTGSFMVFEGARGWCALRAMGIKTPM